jgi:hypothetical protein
MLMFAHTAHADGVETEPLSSAVATSLSLGVTTGGAALMAGGLTMDNRDLRAGVVIAGGIAMIVGPSAGHWYAGRWRPTSGAVVRGIGLGVATLGLVVAAANCNWEIAYDNYVHSCSPRDSTFGIAAITVGLATFVGGAIYDIWTTPRDVERENARRASTPRAWTMAPMVTPHLMGAAIGTAF